MIINEKALNDLSIEEIETRIDDTTRKIQKLQQEEDAEGKKIMWGAAIFFILIIVSPQPLSGTLFVIAMIILFSPKKGTVMRSAEKNDLQTYLYSLKKISCSKKEEQERTIEAEEYWRKELSL